MRDANFNKTKFSFEKEETKAVCFHTALFDKKERRYRMTKCKANFKKTKKVRKYGFDQSEHSSVNPYRQTKIDSFKTFIGCCWLVFVILVPRKLLLNSASFRVALGVWLTIYETRNLS